MKLQNHILLKNVVGISTTIFVGAVLICQASQSTVQAQQEPAPEAAATSIDLVDARPTTKESKVASLQIHVTVNPVQKRTADGIALDLTLENTSNKSLDIVSPLDFLRLELTDGDGHWIDLPNVPSRFQIDKRGGENRLLVPFKVGTIVQDGKSLPASAADERTFSLPANSKLLIPLAIDRIVLSVKDGKELITSPPTGAYKVKINSYLRTREDSKDMRLLKSPQIPINYTE